jgi:hypothetical protein
MVRAGFTFPLALLASCANLVGIEERPSPDEVGGAGGALSGTGAGPSGGGAAGGGLTGGCYSCAPGAPAEPYADSVMASAPLAYWRFDDPAGAQAVWDEVAQALHGDVRGAVTLDVDGALGEPGNRGIDISTGHIELPLNELDFGGASFSVEVWVRPTVINHGYRWVFGKGQHQISDYGLYIHDFEGAPTAQFYRYAEGAVASVAPAAVVEGQWHHIVATYDGASGEAGIFVNGALKNYHHGGHDTANQNPFTWGRLSVVGGDPLLGTLDEGAVYDRALTCGEICAHYRAGTK